MKNSITKNYLSNRPATFDLSAESFPSNGHREFETIIEVPLSARPEPVGTATREIEAVLDGIRGEVAHWCRLSAAEPSARFLRVHVRFVRDENLLAMKALEAGVKASGGVG